MLTYGIFSGKTCTLQGPISWNPLYNIPIIGYTFEQARLSTFTACESQKGIFLDRVLNFNNIGQNH